MEFVPQQQRIRAVDPNRLWFSILQNPRLQQDRAIEGTMAILFPRHIPQLNGQAPDSYDSLPPFVMVIVVQPEPAKHRKAFVETMSDQDAQELLASIFREIAQNDAQLAAANSVNIQNFFYIRKPINGAVDLPPNGSPPMLPVPLNGNGAQVIVDVGGGHMVGNGGVVFPMGNESFRPKRIGGEVQYQIQVIAFGRVRPPGPALEVPAGQNPINLVDNFLENEIIREFVIQEFQAGNYTRLGN
ncbi:hypothetical protein B0O80DRAFT_531593 [Mortierella sp. GBAus27b]|nr:hypothetical protein BGX31_001584 [Mortierella sp. GBA43]KAI8349789.1 hypothetical protein B0O80DRAFT_531593 [Mortierella sp. GBAus27b]